MRPGNFSELCFSHLKMGKIILTAGFLGKLAREMDVECLALYVAPGR